MFEENGYLLFTTQFGLLTTLKKKALENNVERRENAGNQHFVLFLQCFLPFSIPISNFLSHLFCHL